MEEQCGRRKQQGRCGRPSHRPGIVRAESVFVWSNSPAGTPRRQFVSSKRPARLTPQHLRMRTRLFRLSDRLPDVRRELSGDAIMLCADTAGFSPGGVNFRRVAVLSRQSSPDCRLVGRSSRAGLSSSRWSVPRSRWSVPRSRWSVPRSPMVSAAFPMVSAAFAVVGLVRDGRCPLRVVGCHVRMADRRLLSGGGAFADARAPSPIVGVGYRRVSASFRMSMPPFSKVGAVFRDDAGRVASARRAFRRSVPRSRTMPRRRREF